MKTSPIISLVLSLVLGVVAVFAARLWLGDGSDKPAQAVEAEPVRIETRDVLVAVRDIPRGVILDPAWFEKEAMPVTGIPRGAFGSRSTLSETGLERPTLIEIASGDVLSEKMLLAPGMRASLSSRIQPGMRAYTIQMNDVSGVAGFVLPGDRVDVLFIANGAAGARIDDRPVASGGATSDVLLQNVEVMALDLNDDVAGNDPNPFSKATLSVSLEQAQKLSVASESGSMSLALRGSADEAYEQAEAVKLGRERPRPRQVASAPVKRAVPRPTGAQIEVILGDNQTTYQVPTSD
jgi:pilus assembly protein CpaB